VQWPPRPCAFPRRAHPRASSYRQRRLADLLELSLKVDNPLLLRCRILQQVGPTLVPLCQRLPQHDKIVNKTSTTYKQATTTRRKTLTISAWLMVTMLVRKAYMSSLSSNQSSCQGV
jgi:hypothetical protein